MKKNLEIKVARPDVSVGETPLPVSPNSGTTSPILSTTPSIRSSSETSTGQTSTTASSAAPPSGGQLVNVTYTLWVGSDVYEIHNLTLVAPRNESFYGVMVLAAQRSDNFQFSAYEWPNGHYVHTLSGYKEEPMFYHYWLLYRLPSPPDPAFPPGNQFVAPGGGISILAFAHSHNLFLFFFFCFFSLQTNGIPHIF
jgi:gastric intrinsic factor